MVGRRYAFRGSTGRRYKRRRASGGRRNANQQNRDRKAQPIASGRTTASGRGKSLRCNF
jgi:hypothetical protein